MKITRKLLKSASNGNPKSCRILDIQSRDIVIIESLDEYTELLHLNLRGNNIQFVCNLHPCRNIWHLNLSCNKVCHLEGLEFFLALGTLDLSYNELDWRELEKIQHLIVIDLRLNGNKNLQRDACYRQHVIDCLPKVWMLDGLLVTSSESLQVEQFFQESALSPHPIRRKLPKKSDGTSFGHNHGAGVFGREASEFFAQFATNEPRHFDSDQNRMKYISAHLQKRIRLEQRNISRKEAGSEGNILEDLFEARTLDKMESHFCNMILVLLYVFVRFNLPQKLLELALEHLKIIEIGKISNKDLLQSSQQERAAIICLLLNCDKLERDGYMVAEGDLYDELYISLCNSLPEILSPPHPLRSCAVDKTNSQRQRLTTDLISADVLQVMCTFPGFFDTFLSNSDVKKLMIAATGQKNIVSKLAGLSSELKAESHDKKEIEDIFSAEIEKVCRRRFISLSSQISSGMSPNEIFLMTAHQALPRRPINKILRAAEFQTKGQPCPRSTDTPKGKDRASASRASRVPELDDEVLIAPQTHGRIMSLPDSTKWLVQVYSLPEEFSSVIDTSSCSLVSTQRRRYLNLNPRSMEWDGRAGYWKPKGTQGDRITLKPIPRQPEDQISSSNLTPQLIVPYSNLLVDQNKSELSAESKSRNRAIKSKYERKTSLPVGRILQVSSTNHPKTNHRKTNPQHESLRVEPSYDKILKSVHPSADTESAPGVFVTEVPIEKGSSPKLPRNLFH